MKLFISALFASLIAISGAASAQAVGLVGWSQGGGASSSSGVSGAGGGGSAVFGFTQQNSTADASNQSGAQTVQTPGTSTTQTFSTSAGGQNSWSGSIGLAGSGGGSSFGSNGFAAGGGGQTGGAFFIAP